MLLPGRTTFFLQNRLKSSWHWFKKVAETFYRDFAPYWHDNITQLLQMCRLHIHESNFHCIPKVSNWIEIWWLWKTISIQWPHCHGQESSLRWSELTWHINLPEAAIRRCVHYANEGTDVVSNNTQCRLWCLKKRLCGTDISPTLLHHHHQPEPPHVVAE